MVDVEVRSMSFAILRLEAIMTFLPRIVIILGLAPEMVPEPNEAISKQPDLILVFDIHSSSLHFYAFLKLEHINN